MANDEFNNGARHGFRLALLAVRDIDRTLEYPNEEDHTQKSWCYAYEKYNTEKDLLHKIYQSIKNERDNLDPKLSVEQIDELIELNKDILTKLDD